MKNWYFQRVITRNNKAMILVSFKTKRFLNFTKELEALRSFLAQKIGQNQNNLLYISLNEIQEAETTILQKSIIFYPILSRLHTKLSPKMSILIKCLIFAYF